MQRLDPEIEIIWLPDKQDGKQRHEQGDRNKGACAGFFPAGYLSGARSLLRSANASDKLGHMVGIGLRRNAMA